MTILTIEIPDKETFAVSSYIEQLGGKVIKKRPASKLKENQHASLEAGLTEAILISRGDMRGSPFAELWDE